MKKIAGSVFQTTQVHPVATLHIFCRVVDNYGDIGVCWRLARQLLIDYRVTLWVDDLVSFQRICSEVEPALAQQICGGVEVCHWNDQGMDDQAIPVDVVGDVVIEAFACTLPAAYVTAMADRAGHTGERVPVWINLDYLSAEHWVEGCHELVSVHPQLGLKKTFFFPGFTERTGGLLVEPLLAQQRAHFQSDTRIALDFFHAIGVIAPALASSLSADELMHACKVSLFCYPDAPVAQLLTAWSTLDYRSTNGQPVICFVPDGVANAALQAWSGAIAPLPFVTTPVAIRRGSLTVVRLPFMSQDQYDRLLWACDLNFVRGEDSFVRAQLAGKPMVWHIYPQEQDAHREKLQAFMQKYQASMSTNLMMPMQALWLSWNGVEGNFQPTWSQLHDILPLWQHHAQAWCDQISKNKSLAQSLSQFIQKIS